MHFLIFIKVGQIQINMSNFDYRAYLKNNPLLEELPKGQWTDLDKKETEEYSGDIFDLINTAYASIGGNLNYSSASDVTGAQGDSNYEVIDIDDDPEIDAVIVSKKKTAGNKIAAMGHDNSPIAKSKTINKQANLLKTPGNFVEVSGKIKDILLAKGVPVVTDKATIEKVMGGKAVEIQDDGSYTRFISGKKTNKILLGKPSI
jgi:hypothetical protein